MSDLKELSAFVVFDEDGVPQFCAPTASMCHDHINDAISADIDDASKWIVRRLGHTQHSHELPGWVAYLKEAHEQSLDGLESDSRATLLFVIEQMAALTQCPAAPQPEAPEVSRDREALRQIRNFTHGWHSRAVALGADGVDDIIRAAEVAKRRSEFHTVDGLVSEWKFPKQPAAPLATDAGIVNTHANALRAYIDNLSGEAFQGAIRHLGALRDIIDHLAAHPAAVEVPTQRAAQGEAVAWCSLTPNGKIEYFDGKPMIMPGPVGNEHHKTPLYAHPIAPRAPEGGRNDTEQA